MKARLKQFFRGPGSERGLTLMDTLVGVAILACIGVVFLSALTTSTNATGLVEQKVDVDQLARSQLEYLKGLPYIRATDYTSTRYYPTVAQAGLVNLPADYDIEVSDPVSVGGDQDIQEITVTISRDGKSLLSVEGYKVNR